MTRTSRTSGVLLDIMNSIYKELRCTEIFEDFANGRHPTLDMEIWVEKEHLLYSFYGKPMRNKHVLNRKSALSENVKMSSLSQNMVRRMKNISETLPVKERVKVIDEYCIKLATSGYAKRETRRICEAGLKGYRSALTRYLSGKVKMHRSASEGASGRCTWELFPINFF